MATGGAAWLVSTEVARSVGIESLPGQVLQVVGAMGAGLAAFLLVASALRVQELQLVKSIVLRRRRT
jgi:ABC-type phosphonate transport system ATPase subunit